jgi:hypothetical protein
MLHIASCIVWFMLRVPGCVLFVACWVARCMLHLLFDFTLASCLRAAWPSLVAGSEPSPAADVAGVIPVPVQMWQGASPVPPVQMWQGASLVPVQTAIHAFRGRCMRPAVPRRRGPPLDFFGCCGLGARSAYTVFVRRCTQSRWYSCALPRRSGSCNRSTRPTSSSRCFTRTCSGKGPVATEASANADMACHICSGTLAPSFCRGCANGALRRGVRLRDLSKGVSEACGDIHDNRTQRPHGDRAGRSDFATRACGPRRAPQLRLPPGRLAYCSVMLPASATGLPAPSSLPLSLSDRPVGTTPVLKLQWLNLSGYIRHCDNFSGANHGN